MSWPPPIGETIWMEIYRGTEQKDAGWFRWDGLSFIRVMDEDIDRELEEILDRG